MEKTLLILGAGASKDFCSIFPTGLELIKEINYHFLTEKKNPKSSDGSIYLSALMNFIAKILKDDIELFSEIKNQLWNVQLKYEWYYLRNWPNMQPISIDNFINNEIKAGKLNEQAREIIQCSIYYLIKGNEQAFAEGVYNPKKTWIGVFAKKISHFSFEAIVKNLTIVTFNYDRIFEKYFCRLLEDVICFNDKESSEFQRKNVIHVYGSLGTLSDVPVCLANDKETIIKNRHQEIMLIDGKEKKIDILDASEYKKVHFIGFGYDPENLRLLNLHQFTSASFHGTAYHHSKQKIKCLKTMYKIVATDLSCRKYIEKKLIF